MADSKGKQMNGKSTHEQPGGIQGKPVSADDMVVNDSFGEVTPADSTGLDKEKETPEERTGFVKKDPGTGQRED